jgi:citrate lyase beta subunit
VGGALQSGSGVVNVDLEDALPNEEKAHARRAVADLLAGQWLPAAAGYRPAEAAGRCRINTQAPTDAEVSRILWKKPIL